MRKVKEKEGGPWVFEKYLKYCENFVQISDIFC